MRTPRNQYNLLCSYTLARISSFEKNPAKGGIPEIAIVPIKKVANFDSAGAGDIFNISFIYKYLETKDVISSAKFANDCVREKLFGS